MLRLPNHGGEIADLVAEAQWTNQFADLNIKCLDGSVRCHRLVLCGLSPSLKQLLTEQSDDDDDDATLVLPDTTQEQMTSLLALIYSGAVNVYKAEIKALLDLAQLLKLVSIPAAVVEREWTERFPSRLLVKTSGRGRGRPPGKRAVSKKEVQPMQSVLSTKKTRSGRTVVPKRFADAVLEVEGEENDEEEEEQVLEKEEEILGAGDEQDISADYVPRVKAAKDQVAPKPEKPSSDPLRVKLDDLFSVAEAIERSQLPEFHDVTESPAHLEGTETQKLVRTCLVCAKQLLGRNALSRHMRNSHPKVFGPYTCSAPNCAKIVESGEKMIVHRQQAHRSQRAMAIANGDRFECQDCNLIYTTKSRMNKHMRQKHGQTVEANAYECNAPEPCAETFLTARIFSKHMMEEHNLKPWACKSCDKRFVDKQNMQFHTLSHEPTKSFVCDICSAAFTNSRQLFTHRSLHLGRRFLCSDCGYRARSAANLRGHVKIKHEGKGFQCGFCMKKFSSKNNLKNHLRVHTGETPFSCDLCDTKFKRLHHLNCHIESKIHLDVIERNRRLGNEIPDHLDPSKRIKGRTLIEEVPLMDGGPVTHHLVSEDGVTHIVQMEDMENDPMATMEDGAQIVHGGDGEQMIVITSDADMAGQGTYIIPVEGQTLEVMEEGATQFLQVMGEETVQQQEN